HLVEVLTGFARNDRVERAAAAVGDDRTPCCLRLYRYDAEVFEAGKDERFRARHQAGQLFVWHVSEEFDRWAGHGAQTIHVAPAPADFERQAKPSRCLHGEINPLVGYQPRQDEKIILDLILRHGNKTPGFDRRVDDDRVAVVEGFDTRLNLGRNGDEMVHALRGGIIPAPEHGNQRAKREFDRLAKPFSRDVRVEVPDIARRRKTVADVQRIIANAKTVTEAAFVRQHDVILG